MMYFKNVKNENEITNNKKCLDKNTVIPTNS